MAKVFPSLLAADFCCLGKEIEKVSNADALHLDIMDGCFVNNISFGLPIIKSIRKTTKLPFDTHLMIAQPEKYVERFVAVGSNRLSFHIEATKQPTQLLKKIKSLGTSAGIAIDLETSIESAFSVLPFADFVLVMTVKAGFGGQSFQEKALQKIIALKKELEKKRLNTEIAVDGGITPETALLCASAGANVLIAGSTIFNSINPKQKISELQCIATK